MRAGQVRLETMDAAGSDRRAMDGARGQLQPLAGIER